MYCRTLSAEPVPSDRTTSYPAHILALSHAALDSIDDGVLILDQEGKISAFNRRFAEIWNIPPDYTSFSDDAPLWSILKKQTPESVKFLKARAAEDRGILESCSGTLEWRAHPHPSGENPIGQVLSFRDLSERKVLENRENTLAAVIHDLKNMLGSIILALHLLPGGRDKREDCTRGPVTPQRILATARKMDCLLNSFLQNAKASLSGLPLVKGPCDLKAVLADSVAIMEPFASRKHIDFSVSERNALPLVHADPVRVMQVITNLLSNALKYTSPGGTIRITITYSTEVVHVSVLDTGTGIAADQLPHIFERYWQGAQASGNGFGLGLSIVKEIIEAHDGEVWAESTPGVGSVFHFSLPVYPEKLKH